MNENSILYKIAVSGNAGKEMFYVVASDEVNCYLVSLVRETPKDEYAIEFNHHIKVIECFSKSGMRPLSKSQAIHRAATWVLKKEEELNSMIDDMSAGAAK